MKKSIHNRRSFLRGVGVSLAVPPMLSMLPRTEAGALSASTTESGAPLRMAFMSIPNGVQQDRWFPTSESSNF